MKVHNKIWKMLYSCNILSSLKGCLSFMYLGPILKTKCINNPVRMASVHGLPMKKKSWVRGSCNVKSKHDKCCKTKGNFSEELIFKCSIIFFLLNVKLLIYDITPLITNINVMISVDYIHIIISAF